MPEDLINKKDIYFPSHLGNNDKLLSLLNRANQTLDALHKQIIQRV